MKSFPKSFLWGASTAAHQVEGGTHNQWSVWELEHATELAKHAKERVMTTAKAAGHTLDWKAIAAKASKPENYVSGRGVDHYRRYEEDFDLLEELNLNAFRFSIEWSRIEPEEGAWNAAAIEHYRAYIKSLRRRNIEPIVTLWHWTVPVWFSELGEFEKATNLKYFERFVQKMADEFGNDLRYVITLNEPAVHVLLSYLWGARPPQQRNVKMALRVFWNLARAHKSAYAILKQKNIALRVGVSYAIANVQPKRAGSILHGISAKLAAYVSSWWFLNRIKRHQDFVGVNYYSTEYKDARPYQNQNPSHPVNDLGWYMEPEGLYPMLTQVWRRYGKPIIITENGVADSRDQYRRWWLEQTMLAMQKALSDGVDLRGYLHWSLLDNFEWDYGWWPEFGLVHVDREHGMKREIRDSAHWYARYVAQQQKK
ncbi:MAG TPA: glycoside hydrolase family 1 protein [Candidatus Saccharimonadales bacterium]|nr:glycoside hydrolase family 1 protein [Candidatus Saccharimonadales bacterium]